MKIRKLTNNILADIASKYQTKSEFQKLDSSAYQTARRKGILDEICQHMHKKSFSIPQLICKYFFDNLLMERGLYNNRKIIAPYEIDIFYQKHNLAIEYDGKGWHNHDETIKRDTIKNELCQKNKILLLRFKENNRKYEEDISKQIIQYIKIINKHCNVKLNKKQILALKIDYQYLFEQIKTPSIDEILQKTILCKNIKDFQRLHGYDYYYLMKTNQLHIIDNIRTRKRHSINNVKKICLSISTYSDLITNHYDIYLFLRKNNILKQYTSHMIKGRRDPYSVEEIKTIAKQYKTKYQFKKYAGGAFCKAKKLNLLKELFN